jgi:hypothetical protein
VIVTETEIENAIDLYYGISGFVDVGSSDDEVTEISDLFDETRIVELVDSIITQSQRYRCSDIHVEPREKDPNHKKIPEVTHYVIQIYKKLGDNAKAKTKQDQLLANAPDSKWAKFYK